MNPEQGETSGPGTVVVAVVAGNHRCLQNSLRQLFVVFSMVTPSADNNSCSLAGQYNILFTHIHD